MEIYSEVISNTVMSSNFINTLYFYHALIYFIDRIQISSDKSLKIIVNSILFKCASLKDMMIM